MTFTSMIGGPDGQFGAYIAKPKSAQWCGPCGHSRDFGVNEVMRELADYYAGLDTSQLCLIFSGGIDPGISITDKTPEDMTKAFDLFGKFNVDTGILDIQATLDFARTLAPKVGAVGYCLGGLLAYLTACRTNVDASVSFYGVSIDTYSKEAAHVAKPLMLHVASEDKFVSKEAQAVISETAKSLGALTLHIYQGLDHAFARPGGEHFDVEGAALANNRTAAFFAEHLAS